MKNYAVFFISWTFAVACSKQGNDDNMKLSFPYDRENHSFMLVDSVGNNILPTPLPSNSVFNPDDFFAYSERGNDLRRLGETKYYNAHPRIGHTFGLSELYLDIFNDPSYQKDSTVVWYICFGMPCDTIKFIYNEKSNPRFRSIIFNQDTIYNNASNLTVIPLQKNF